MSHLRFQYNEEKLVQALAYLSLHGVQNLTKMKAAKLLYFADKMHLNRYGRPIIGDWYACMEHGPVPSLSLNEMDSAVATAATQPVEGSTEEPAILRVLNVQRDYYPSFVIKSRECFHPEVFSVSDLEVLEEVVQTHGNKTATQLRNESHKEKSWKLANEHRASGSSFPMRYEDFFDDDRLDMLHLVLEDERDSDEFDAVISKGVATAR